MKNPARFPLAFLLLVILLLGCSGESPPADPVDGDGEPSDGDVTDPCAGAAVNCAPGVCEATAGKARCVCPAGYRAERYTCVPAPEPDGDGETPDPPDGDGEEDAPDGDTPPDGDADGDQTGIPACRIENDVFPCRTRLPILDTNEQGEFWIGGEGTRNPYFGAGVWENWVLADIRTSSDFIDVGGGIFVIDMRTREAFKICHQSTGECGGLPNIRDGFMIWRRLIERISDDSTVSQINRVDLATMTNEELTDSYSAKESLRLWGSRPFWLDSRVRLGRWGYGIFTLNEAGEEVRVDQVSGREGAYEFNILNNRIVLPTFYGPIGILDLDTQTHHFLDVPTTVCRHNKPKMSGSRVYYSDNRNEPSGNARSNCCWFSLYQYDLETDTETVIRDNTDGKDYLFEDVWEDWLLYSYYNEDNYVNPSRPEWKYCGLNGAAGDLYLRYLPTGEEWNLTNQIGNQKLARMWGPLVIWIDTRNNLRPIFSGAHLYGLNLCKHPDLKDRFPQCAEREGWK